MGAAMINSLNSWLDAAVNTFAQQEAKIRLFHQREIYSEYWVQNELSILLPWEQPGIYIVDCGPALALPAGVSKYPDFSIRFGLASDSPLYFIELKDLLTNAAQNVRKLREETKVMVKMSREATSARWRTYNGKTAQYAAAMAEAVDSAPIVFCGLTVGARKDVPENLPGFRSTLRDIAADWVLALYELADPAAVEIEAQETPEPEETEAVESEPTTADLSMAKALEAAHSCESSSDQIAAELAISTVTEAHVLKRRIEAMLVAYNVGAKTPILHAKPWVWTPKSSGQPMTASGREFGVEIRFSYGQKPAR